jgi:hypothetical protein
MRARIMADVPRAQQRWVCGDCGDEHEFAPILGGALVCGCGSLNTISEAIRLPGLRCPRCFRVSVDQGGGKACYGHDLGVPHPWAVMEEVWLVGHVAGEREEGR